MDWVPVGKITKPHALKGELKLYPFASGRGIFSGLRRMVLTAPGGKRTELRVESIRGSGTLLIIQFAGLKSIEAARVYCGCTALANREDFAPLPAGEYYWFEIQGLAVYDESGKCYGRVREIMETGSNDVFVVSDGKREILLPMIDAVVKTIDTQAGKLVFHIVEGLLEDHPV